MRTVSKRGFVLVGLLIASTAQLMAQMPEPGANAPQSGSAAGGGRAGRFGQMGQPVRGTVITAAAGKATIKTDGGETYEITLGENARVMKDRQVIQIADIKPGDMLTAMGKVDAAKKTVEASMLMDVDAATVAKAKENLGKTYITGRITAIDAENLKLTVERQDNVTQVIAVDEGTSFQRGMRGVAQEIQAAGGMAGGFGGGFGGRGMGRQRGGQTGTPAAPESITLADIKVGDIIAATGSLKNGTFTATKMGVTQRGAGSRGERGMGAGAAPPPQQ